MKTGIIGLGAGGHAKGLIEIIRLSENTPLAGLLDPRKELWGKEVLGVPVLGDDSLLETLLQTGVGFFFIGIGGTANNFSRRKLFEWAMGRGLCPISAIHPRSIVSVEARLGRGIQVFAGAIVSAGSHLETHVTINTGAIIEHDCYLGPHAHVASGARVGGGAHIAAGAHIGAGANISQSIRIGEHAIVGAGAIVTEDVSPYTTVTGTPARPIKRAKVDLSRLSCPDLAAPAGQKPL